MAALLQAGHCLARKEWLDLQKRAIFDFGKWDIQCEDHSVLAPFPLLMERETAEFLNETAEALAKEAFEAEAEILSQPNILDRLGLPRALRKAFRKNASALHGRPEVRVMRFDFHLTVEGWRISEVNADVPGGFVEASGWNSLFAESLSGAIAPPAPSKVYAQAIHRAVGANALVAFVHATAYSDDRQVMHHLARYFHQQDLRVCLLSPVHLRWEDGHARIQSAFATGWPDAIIRFFPAEWLPNLRPEERWRPYFEMTKTVLSNPATAIVLQTKRFPLIWDGLQTDLSTWRKMLPETRELGGLDGAFDETWVLKPALGRVGEGVGIHGITVHAELLRLAREARRRPQGWIVQKRFNTLPMLTAAGPKYPCIGVFTIGGKAAGFYGRIADCPIINQNAQDVAVLVSTGREG